MGALGYILKDSAITGIVTGIKAVQAGQSFSSPALVSHLVSRRAASNTTGLDSLTPAERRVLQLIAQYKTTKEIAEALYVSPRTIETHCTNICQKLNLKGSHSLMRLRWRICLNWKPISPGYAALPVCSRPETDSFRQEVRNSQKHAGSAAYPGSSTYFHVEKIRIST